MTYTSTTSNQLVVSGPYTSIEARIETVANVYPGRLVKRGTTDDDVVVCTAAGLPCGWAGYDNASPAVKPATIDTIYVVGDRIPVVSCVGSVIRATLATSQTITLGDALVAGATGFVTAATVIAATVGSGAATASAVDATRPNRSRNRFYACRWPHHRIRRTVRNHNRCNCINPRKEHDLK